MSKVLEISKISSLLQLDTAIAQWYNTSVIDLCAALFESTVETPHCTVS